MNTKGLQLIMSMTSEVEKIEIERQCILGTISICSRLCMSMRGRGGSRGYDAALVRRCHHAAIGARQRHARLLCTCQHSSPVQHVGLLCHRMIAMEACLKMEVSSRAVTAHSKTATPAASIPLPAATCQAHAGALQRGQSRWRRRGSLRRQGPRHFQAPHT